MIHDTEDLLQALDLKWHLVQIQTNWKLEPCFMPMESHAASPSTIASSSTVTPPSAMTSPLPVTSLSTMSSPSPVTSPSHLPNDKNVVCEPTVTSENSLNDLVQSDEATNPAAEDFDNHNQNAAGTFFIPAVSSEDRAPAPKAHCDYVSLLYYNTRSIVHKVDELIDIWSSAEPRHCMYC